MIQFNDLIYIMGFTDWIYFLLAFPIVLSLHEASHALAAYYLGDPTAKAYGRLTLNPLKHIDVFGFLMLVIVHFGWGKPVPVNPKNFKNEVRDSSLTALAGPLSNFILAFVTAILLKYLGPYLPKLISGWVWYIFNISLFWGIFNLIPVPPLDGGKIIAFVVPKKYVSKYMKFQETGAVYFIAFMFFDFLILNNLFGFSVVRTVIVTAYEFVKNLLLFGV